MSRTAGLVSSKSLRFFQSIRDGHVVEGRLSHVGPIHHNSNKMRCFGDVPLEAMSAGLLSVGTYLQRVDGIRLTVSITLLQTYDLSLVGDIESQHSTIVESLQA